MKKLLLSTVSSLSLLFILASLTLSQTDRNRPKPKPQTSREIGQPENPQPESSKTTAAQMGTKPRAPTAEAISDASPKFTSASEAMVASTAGPRVIATI